MFQAFEKYCKVDNGYVGTPDVTTVPPRHDNTMQSFFLAVRKTLLWHDERRGTL